MIPSGRKTQFAFLAIVAALALSGWIAWQTDLHEIRPEQVQSWGFPAIVGYVLIMTLLGGLGVPPVLFMVPTVAFWSFPVAVVICLAGGMGASLVGFLLSRYCMRETMAPRIPEKIARYEHRLETHGISTVLILRLLFYLFPPINWMLGISEIPLAVFAGATFVGMLPGTIIYLLTGKGVIGFLTALSPLQAGALIGAGAAGLFFWWRWATRGSGAGRESGM